MTDEERKEAERLAHEYNESTRDHSVRAYTIGDIKAYERLAFRAGYAAACEAKRLEYGRAIGSEAFDATVTELEAERARSARLLDGLKEFAILETVVAPDGRRWPLGRFAQSYITEYQADRD